MKKRLFLTSVLLLLMTWPCHAAPINAWAVGEPHKINPETGRDFNPFVKGDLSKKNYLWDSATNTVKLFGARNEYISFQIIIDAKEDVEGVDVAWTDFTGPDKIQGSNIKLFKEHYTKVWKKSDWPLPSTGTGEYPDALIPFGVPEYSVPFGIKRGRNQAVWVDIYIPKEVAEGNYKGAFVILVNNEKVKTVNADLTVYDFTLPDERHLMCWSNYYGIKYGYGLKDNDPRYEAIEESIWKLCHEHRVNALLRHAHIRPKVSYNEYGAQYIDFSEYSRRLGKYIDGSIFDDKVPPDMFLLPLSGGTEYRWPKDGPNKDPDYYFSQGCKDFAAYFKEMGWPLDNSYIYLSDEPTADKIGRITHDAGLVHEADGNLKTVVALHKAFNEETLEKLSGSVDLWLIDGANYDSKLLTPRRELGEKVGFYQQGEPWCGNESLDSDGLGLRTWPWIAWKYNADCVYLYSMTEWHGVNNSIWIAPRNKSWSNSQGVLLYPGSYIGILDIVGSIRLKQMRRGMQDYEYFYLAKKAGKEPDKIVNTIVEKALDEADESSGSYGEWSHNPEDWNLARMNLARMITGEELLPMNNVHIPSTPRIKVIRKKIAPKIAPLKSGWKDFLKKLWIRLPRNIQNIILGIMGKSYELSREPAAKNTGVTKQSPQPEEKRVKVTIDPSKEKGKVSRLLYGTNLSGKMESDRKIWDFVKARGITSFRFPGGGSPGWHWKTGEADFNEKMKNMPLGNIDYLVKFCRKADAELIAQVNVESGTPEEAAELVDYLNNKVNFRVNYWELGNEVYGDWDKAYTTPEKYAQLIKEYNLAMKAKDPTIKIGANWGGRYYDKVNWDNTIVRLAGDYIDFVSIHWYPNHINNRHKYEGRIHPTPEEVMSNSMEIPNMVKRVERIIENEAPHRKGKIEVTFLEWDGSWDAPSDDPTPPYAENAAIWSLANALFYADSLGQFAENGVTASAHYSLQECMFGLIRGWDIAEGWGGNPWKGKIIRPKAYAIELFSKHFGDTLIESNVENSPYYYKEQDWWPDSYEGKVLYITCYGGKTSVQKKLSIILINKHAEKDLDVEFFIDEAVKVKESGNIRLLTGPGLKAQNDSKSGSVSIKELILNNVGNLFIYKVPASSVAAIELELY